MKRLVLMGEGDGDRQALVILAKRLLVPHGPWHFLQLDPNVITLGDLPGLLNQGQRGESDRSKWRRRIRYALKRRNVGGVLAILDGDAKRRSLGGPFCAFNAARQLRATAEQEGAGKTFSLAIVFACKEYESWLIAGVESLAGKPLREGLEGIASGTVAPHGDLEQSPRDAKRWLSERMAVKYNPPRDQAHLTELVELELIRQRGLRSFRRLEHALAQLVESFQVGGYIATPK